MNLWPSELAATFWGLTAERESGCLEWRGEKDKSGYGRFRRYKPFRIDVKSHRASFWLTNGWLPGLIRHTCDNPPCVRPEHLLPGDHKLNAQDAVERGRFRFRKRNLSDEAEQAIRDRYAAGGCTYRSLAAEYGLSYGHTQLVLGRGE